MTSPLGLDEIVRILSAFMFETRFKRDCDKWIVPYINMVLLPQGPDPTAGRRSTGTLSSAWRPPSGPCIHQTH